MATALQKQVSYCFKNTFSFGLPSNFIISPFIYLFSGVIVPGGFGKRGILGKMEACKWCRANDKPFLGICLGLQVAVIEFARNVLSMETANSTEIDPNTEHPLVIDMPEHNSGQMGGTMRLGKRHTQFTDDNSIIS